MNSLLPVLIGHSLGEFVFVTQELRDRKGRFHVLSLAVHGVTIGLIMYAVLVWQTSSWLKPMWGAIIISAGHVGLECLFYGFAKLLSLYEKQVGDLLGNFHRGFYLSVLALAEQLVHVLYLVYITGSIWPPQYPLTTLLEYGAQLSSGSVIAPLSDRFAFRFLLVILTSFGASEFLRVVLTNSFSPSLSLPNPVPNPVPGPVPGPAIAVSDILPPPEAMPAPVAATKEQDISRSKTFGDQFRTHWTRFIDHQTKLKISAADEKNLPLGTGRWIGISERIIIMLMVVLGAWAGIGFIIAAKSMARYKELDSKATAEYYIVGTLLSSIIGVLAGMVLTKVSFK